MPKIKYNKYKGHMPKMLFHCFNLGNYYKSKPVKGDVKMKIAIPVNENSMSSAICPSFGRTPYFLIYNVDTKESKFLDNEAASKQGGAGIKASQVLVDQGVDAIITPRCGENAADVLKAANIKLYRTINASIKDNIEAFERNKLELLFDIHPGFHNHGGK
jgi:predicted Fe-Mo cluster-binding NifX family protein